MQSIHRMTQLVVGGMEQLVQRQAEIWQQTISSAHGHWDRLQQSSGQQFQSALSPRSMKRWKNTPRTSRGSSKSPPNNLSRRWEQWHVALQDNAKLLYAQQQELGKQGEMMTQAIRAAGDVVQLERALNDNLSALAGAKNFEETVMSLAAAIHLLNARLGRAEIH